MPGRVASASSFDGSRPRDHLLRRCPRLVRDLYLVQHAADTNWSDASNWGGTAPSSTDVGLFSVAFSYTSQPSLTGTAAIGGIWDTGGGVLTIGGSALTLYGATINSNPGTGIEVDPGAGTADDQRPARSAEQPDVDQ